jgi:hypothetical protein
VLPLADTLRRKRTDWKPGDVIVIAGSGLFRVEYNLGPCADEALVETLTRMATKLRPRRILAIVIRPSPMQPLCIYRSPAVLQG